MRKIRSYTKYFENLNNIDEQIKKLGISEYYPIIKDTVIDETTFEYKGREYRLTGYYYVYNFKDSNDRRFACVDMMYANAVSGYGIAGCIAPISEIKILERKSIYLNSFTDLEKKQQSKQFRKDTDEEKSKYVLLKTMPKDLTEEQFTKISIKRAVAMKNLK